MNGKDEVKKEIERLKKEMNDYLKISSIIRLDEKVKQKRIDFYLDDLSKLIKKLNE
ncbi:MAG: hypothetical protein LBP98_10570 [Tannerella sp.]|jgi:hypothetical protein|nr:hypothetical protein [Tannerella sp.]